MEEGFSCPSDPDQRELQGHEPHGMSFVDGLASMRTFTSPEVAREEASTFCEPAYCAASAFGLKLQISKTKPLVHFAGPGSRQAKRDFFSGEDSSIGVPMANSRVE
eukprot:9327033-Pyramimonas_sp.AAC.1